MNDGLAILLVIVMVGLAIAGAVYAYQQQKKRREALARLAARLGWSYDPDSYGPGDECAGFSAFTRGHSRERFNSMSGSVEICGRRAGGLMGDFRYKVTSSNGKTTTTRTYTFSYLILDIPLPGVADLLIRPENLLDRFAGAIGFDDIDFESEEFSRKFHVKSPDRKFAYDVIHPRMMEFLMAGLPAAIHISGGRLCLTDGSGVWTAEEFDAMIRWALKFFEQWPEYLVKDLAGRG